MSSEILTTLLSEYEQRKRRAELDLESRKNDLFLKIPRLAEIEQDLNNFAINTAKNILLGSKNSLEDLNKKVEELKKEKQKILAQNNIPESFLQPYYNCKICNDTGYIQTEGTASTLCPCLKQKLLDVSYNKSNISNLSKENFDTFNLNIFSDKVDTDKYKLNISPRKNMAIIKQKCIEFVENFENIEYKNLLFTGNTRSW